METSISCTNVLGQRFGMLAKRWIGGMSSMGAVAGHPLDGRTTTTITRKRGWSVVLEGETGGIVCTVSIGHRREVVVSLKGLPERLAGTRPFLSFPAAASAKGIAWAPGPRMGIVHASESVSATGELRCVVARSRSRADLAQLFRLVGVFSEEGDSQPACSVRLRVFPRS